MSDNYLLNSFQEEYYKDFFENSLCGFLYATPDGKIIKTNIQIGVWLECSQNDLIGKRFSELLSVGGKIYYETHLFPLLKMQGFFNEIATELVCKNSTRMPVFINGSSKKDADGNTQFLRLMIIDASDRLVYEKNLKHAKLEAERKLSHEREFSVLREQFIAILGHDLRNPLQAISMSSEIILHNAKDPVDARIATTIKNSSARMKELIENIMDFARTRMGGGLNTNLQKTYVVEFLMNVVSELRSSFPHRAIDTTFNIGDKIVCDVNRLGQLLSNLLANAIAYGSPDSPVIVSGFINDGILELSVINNGKAIPEEALARLFEPFTRNEKRSINNGLGLGLYISSEIAKAHHGTLTATSSESETRFTFKMPIT